MNDLQTSSFTSFDGSRLLATGPLPVVVLVVKRAIEGHAAGPVLIFDNDTGRSIDIDTRGSEAEVVARLVGTTIDEFAESTRSGLVSSPESDATTDQPRGRGRPKLGVVAREVTLLPRHWEWLGLQSGGASVALRKLVEEARRTHKEKDRIRQTQERAYHFMSAMAGNLPGFEEATRALFANNPQKFSSLTAEWPADIRDHATWLAFGESATASVHDS